MNHLARILLVVAPRLGSELLFKSRLYLCQSLQAVLETAIPFVDTPVKGKVTVSGAMDDFVDRGSRYAVLTGQVAYPYPHMILFEDFLTLSRRQSRPFMNCHMLSTVGRLPTVNNAVISYN